MGWFGNLCRNLGLMVHNIKNPETNDKQSTVVRKEVEESRQGNITLRKTTIEEIEINDKSKLTDLHNLKEAADQTEQDTTDNG